MSMAPEEYQWHIKYVLNSSHGISFLPNSATVFKTQLSPMHAE